MVNVGIVPGSAMGVSQDGVLKGKVHKTMEAQTSHSSLPLVRCFLCVRRRASSFASNRSADPQPCDVVPEKENPPQATLVATGGGG